MLAEHTDDRANPEQAAAATQARKLLDSFLDELAEDVRTVFVLFELEGMTMASIGETLELPPGTVASRLRRAREEFHAAAKRFQAGAGGAEGAMSDPARLLSGEANDFEKELIGSWNAEQPSEAGRASVLAMVGLGVGAATVAGTAAAATKAGAVAGGSIAPKAVAAGSAALLKWLAVGLVGVATAGAAVAYVRHQRQSRPGDVRRA